ncbi:UDP-N-acetylmuramoyl-L-alanine--D-glutamate ligase, partial [bacterium]|nr:UDP-N-acetylmuramoyl-L-alanine--D-glutamate ligase [bacterium]
GKFDFKKIAEAELIVMSPGISSFKFPEFRKLKQPGSEVISEIELAFRFFRGKLIAVTGTNGKSTTASLVHHLFKVAGKKSYLLGNIGTPFISEAENIKADEYAVVEVSCFQLEEIKSFKPDYVILTNISRDHLDRYPSMESYMETRKNIFRNITSQDKVIFNFDDPLTQKHFSRLSAEENYRFSRKSKVSRGAFLSENNFIFRNHGRDMVFANSSYLQIPGAHNIENALSASLPLLLEGIDTSLIKKGLKTFRGLKHRMEFVSRFGGVDFINDSKATNVDSVLRAVESFNSAQGQIVIIMGGKDKAGDFSLLKPALNDNIKLVLLGEAAALIESCLSATVNLKRVKTMAEAVRVSFDRAKPAGLVILSPGCASFDMFKSFEHRGDVFKAEVMKLKEKQNG